MKSNAVNGESRKWRIRGREKRRNVGGRGNGQSFKTQTQTQTRDTRGRRELTQIKMPWHGKRMAIGMETLRLPSVCCLHSGKPPSQAKPKIPREGLPRDAKELEVT